MQWFWYLGKLSDRVDFFLGVYTEIQKQKCWNVREISEPTSFLAPSFFIACPIEVWSASIGLSFLVTLIKRKEQNLEKSFNERSALSELSNRMEVKTDIHAYILTDKVAYRDSIAPTKNNKGRGSAAMEGRTKGHRKASHKYKAGVNKNISHIIS